MLSAGSWRGERRNSGHVNFNNANADQSVAEITGAVSSARTRMLMTFIATFLFACFGAYRLLEATNRPLRKLNEIVDVMRGGDFVIAGLRQCLTVVRDAEFAIAERGEPDAAVLSAQVGPGALGSVIDAGAPGKKPI
jgi:hypothetical protein